ncbi:MAG: zinc ribbon domain-containing protein [Thermoanaerobaculia bacterium]|nr:zinc ribbon domain-containing protein [Thermoanaerobaculia bacterium]
MPLYEYACTDCGHRFEVLQRLGQGAEGLICPSCDASRVEKQYSTFAAATSDGGRAAGSSCLAPTPGGGCGAPSGFT